MCCSDGLSCSPDPGLAKVVDAPPARLGRRPSRHAVRTFKRGKEDGKAFPKLCFYMVPVGVLELQINWSDNGRNGLN